MNAAGGKEEIKPVVIWKSETPRCFKRLDKSHLPVSYYSQPKSWMTAEIMYHILQKINAQLRSKQRSIVLLLDNAGCHPKDLSEKYSNIRIIFMPPNTTSVLQPLDLGIIKNFKVYYRKLLLQHIIAKLEECSTAHEVVKSVDVLIAIRWVAQAWKSVTSDTIKKCFRRAGITGKDFEVVSRGVLEDDPFADLELDYGSDELQAMIARVGIAEDACSAEEFTSADDQLPVCQDFSDDTWNEDFLAELGPRNKDSCLDEGHQEDEEEADEGEDMSRKSAQSTLQRSRKPYRA